MLLEEARWWRRAIDTLDASLVYPMLNVGSSTEQFRTIVQPFIDEYLFLPARETGHRVVHLDTKSDVGVDLVGNLTDASFRKDLAQMRFKSVMCCNLLEHVTIATRTAICAALTEVVSEGGYLFVSCPRRFPVHLDPIDTGFRPSPEDLAALFPGTDVVASEEVVGTTYLQQLRRRQDKGAREILRLLLPFYKPRRWWVHAGYFLYLFRHFTTSCVVLRANRALHPPK